MQFRTPINIAPFDFRITHSAVGLLSGSCFAEHIGQRMLQYKLPVVANPFGILFNPASIAAMFNRLESGQPYEVSDLVRSGDRWSSFDHHSSLSASDPQQALRRMNQALELGYNTLRKAEYLILTLGTSWVYRHRETRRVVSNCHKHPAGEFVRERLSVHEIVDCFAPLLEGILKSKKVIWTVSPVRHLHDGLAENALSKATLRVAVAELSARYEGYYFPAFEILTDDLRDYRFYDTDMVHPSQTTIDYVWEHFCTAAVDPASCGLFEQIDTVHQAMEHRPFNPEGAAHGAFRRRQGEAVRTLQRLHPTLDFSHELEFFTS